MADEVLRRMKAPAALREQAVTLIDQHMTALQPDKKLLRRRIRDLGWDTVEKLYSLQRADLMSKGTDTPEDREHFVRVRKALDELHRENGCLSLSQLQISGRDLMDLGYQGRNIGLCLQTLLDRVMDEELPNDHSALLAAAAKQK